MTLILKSDKIASANVGNIHGYKGPSDYIGMLDFNQQEYFTLLGGARQNYSIYDSVSVARDSIAESTDAFGTRHIAANNMPRLQYVPNLGLTGLLSEPGRKNLVPSPINPPAIQAVPMPAAAASNHVILSAWGSGDAVLTDPTLTLVAVLPIVGGVSKFYTKSSGSALNPTLTTNGYVERVHVEVGGPVATSFPLTAAPYERPSEIIKLKSPFVDLLQSGEGTIVAHYLALDAPRTGGTITAGSLYCRKTSDAAGGVYMTSSTPTSPSSGGTNTLTTIPSGSAPANGTVKISMTGPWQKNMVNAFGFNKGGDFVMSTYRQRNQSLATEYKVSVPNEVGLNGGSGQVLGAGGAVFAGVIVRVVIYNRKLSLDEMSLVASAWQ